MEIVIILAIIAVVLYWMRGGEKSEVERTPVQPEVAPDLDMMTKAELIQFADGIGAKYSKSWTKAKIVEAIVAELMEEIKKTGF